MFVRSDGTTIKIAAFAGNMNKLSNAIETVGKPIPEIPLITPADKNTPITTKFKLVSIRTIIHKR
jgi:hypothetical protein